jgi:hypothetical protein
VNLDDLERSARGPQHRLWISPSERLLEKDDLLRLIAVARAARSSSLARDAMLSEVTVGGFTPGESVLVKDWIDANSKLDDALDALNQKVDK